MSGPPKLFKLLAHLPLNADARLCRSTVPLPIANFLESTSPLDLPILVVLPPPHTRSFFRGIRGFGDRERVGDKAIYIFWVADKMQSNASSSRSGSSSPAMPPNNPPKGRQTREVVTWMSLPHKPQLFILAICRLSEPLSNTLPPPISILPYPLITDRARYESSFDIATSWAARLSFRIFTVCYLGTMGQRGKQVGEEAEYCYRASAIHYFEYRVRVLDKHTCGDVLARLGWDWKWEYGSYADNDSGDCQGEEIPESSIPAFASGFQLQEWLLDWHLEDVWLIRLSICHGCLGPQEYGTCLMIQEGVAWMRAYPFALPTLFNAAVLLVSLFLWSLLPEGNDARKDGP